MESAWPEVLRPEEEGPHHVQLAAASKKKKNRGRMSWLLIGIWLTLSLQGPWRLLSAAHLRGLLQVDQSHVDVLASSGLMAMDGKHVAARLMRRPRFDRAGPARSWWYNRRSCCDQTAVE